jgi:hypothetical protein
MKLPLTISEMRMVAASERKPGQNAAQSATDDHLATSVNAVNLEDLAISRPIVVTVSWIAEAGCLASEIAAITGHKTLAEVERYTRAADRLARQAIQRQSESQKGKLLVDEVANTADEALKINDLMWKMARHSEWSFELISY